MSRLLLIEDDPDIRKLLERYFERAGMQVIVALDGDEGLRMFLNNRVDLVLIDGLLPKKSGFEVVPLLRKMQHGKDVGIIMMTAAFKTPKARKEAIDGGVDAFFTKPFVLSDLKSKVDELLARTRAGVPHTRAGPGVAQGVHAGGPLPRTSPGVAGSGPAPRAVPTEPVSVPIVERPTMPKAAIDALREEVRRDVTPRPRPPPAPPLPENVVVASPNDVARVLLQCARHRLSGTVRLVDEASELVITYLRGVVVAASDNLREQLLGEMLWKQGRLTLEQMRELNTRMNDRGERVAESLLALGFISAPDTLALVDDQSRTRVRRALLWTGKLKVVVDEADALRRAVEGIELLDVLLAFGLEAGQIEEAQRFVASNKGKPLLRGPAFDTVLLALSRTRPSSVLPGVLIAGSPTATPTVAEAASVSSPSEVYAAHLAELIRLPDDPILDVRPLPTLMRSEITPNLVDRALTDRVSGLLLKARGRSAYALFDKPSTASGAEMVACAEAMLTTIGRDVLGGGSLGPAAPASRELWAMLEDYRELFADPARRAMYDVMWNEGPPVPPSPSAPTAPGPEDAFLAGQLALHDDNLVAALASFEAAAAGRPDDAEYTSWVAWARILSGDVAGGIKGLMGAMRAHPQSMRPMFFLGLHAARNGETDKARALLQECTRRSPHDVEVQAALAALE